MGSRNERGRTLIEVLLSMLVMAALLVIAIPNITNMAKRIALRQTAGRIQAVLCKARSRAEMQDRYCGVKFSQVGDKWCYAIYDDGNLDGIRNQDITSGKDVRVEGPIPIADIAAPVKIGFPAAGVKDFDTNKWIDGSATPVNFNQSTICSFSPAGSATPGSVYLTAGERYAAMVRSSGESGQIRIGLYDYNRKGWED